MNATTTTTTTTELSIVVHGTVRIGEATVDGDLHVTVDATENDIRLIDGDSSTATLLTIERLLMANGIVPVACDYEVM